MDDDIIGRSQYYEEDEVSAQDDGIGAISQYHRKRKGQPRTMASTPWHQYHDEEEEGVAKDDGIDASQSVPRGGRGS